MFDYSVETSILSLNSSLKLLKTTYIDLLIVHDVEFCQDENLITSFLLPKLYQVFLFYIKSNKVKK